MSTATLLILFARTIDPSALESASNSLETMLDSLEFRLLVSSLLVGAGVLIECWPDTLEFWHELRWPMTGFPHGKFWPLIGGILVAVGVIGEFWYTGQISSKEIELRGNSHKIEAALNAEAQEANERAGKANERAGKAEKQAAELLGDIQPRRLSPDQEKDIADALKSYADKTVGVATYTQDAEAMLLAVQIANTLGKAKILVHNRIGTFGALGFPLMQSVIVDKNSLDKKLESALFKALKTKGGLASFNDSVTFGRGSTMYLPPGPTHEDAFIFIGEKPLVEETLPKRLTSNSSKPITKP